MSQHHFYHWLHIRSLYESQFPHYVAVNALLPLHIHSDTRTSSRTLAADSFRVHLTTTTTTAMPHATATTSTSTSYRQLTSDVLRLPPSPPLLGVDSFCPPAPFSYDFAYPSHPFSYPPASVLEALPPAGLDDDCWSELGLKADAGSEADTEEEEEAEKEPEEEEEQWPQRAKGRWLLDGECEEREDKSVETRGEAADDSDDEWTEVGADVDVTEVDQRSSYAPSYAPSYACSDAENEEDEAEAEAEEVKRAEKLPLWQSKLAQRQH